MAALDVACSAGSEAGGAALTATHRTHTVRSPASALRSCVVACSRPAQSLAQPRALPPIADPETEQAGAPPPPPHAPPSLAGSSASSRPSTARVRLCARSRSASSSHSGLTFLTAPTRARAAPSLGAEKSRGGRRGCCRRRRWRASAPRKQPASRPRGQDCRRLPCGTPSCRPAQGALPLSLPLCGILSPPLIPRRRRLAAPAQPHQPPPSPGPRTRAWAPGGTGGSCLTRSWRSPLRGTCWMARRA